MVQVILVTDDWSKLVEVSAADDVIEAEGMSWEREGIHDGNRIDGDHATDIPPDVPRYVPAVGA
jgi:hypothetical protein